MFLKQLSIFVENRPGRLAEITETLSKEQIDIRAVNIADTRDFGILRLIVDDPERAESALKNAGCTVSITDVIAIEMEDRPGSLSSALKILFANHISVEYMYAFWSKIDGRASVILRVEENERAIGVLHQNGIKTL